MNYRNIISLGVFTFLGSLFLSSHATAESLPPLPAPYNLRVVNSAPHSLSMQWNFANTGIRVGGFVLYRAPGVVAANDVALQPWKYFYDYELSWTDSTVLPGETYTYCLRSYLNGYGPLGVSEGVAISVTLPSLPAPSNFKVENSAPNSVSLKWDFSSAGDVDGLVLYRALGRVGADDSAFVPWKYFYSTETQWTDIAVEPGKKYTYKLLSYKNGAGVSPAGPGNICYVELSSLPTPANAKSERGDHFIKLTWEFQNLGMNIDGIVVYRAFNIVSDGNDSSLVPYKYLSATATSWTDSTVMNGVYYTYKILAYKNGVGNSPVTDSNLVFVSPEIEVINNPLPIQVISNNAANDIEISARISVAPGTSAGLITRYTALENSFYTARFYRRKNASERNSVSLWRVYQGVWKRIGLVNVTPTGGKLTLKIFGGLIVNFNDQTVLMGSGADAAGDEHNVLYGTSIGVWNSDPSRPAIITEWNTRAISSADFRPSANVLAKIDVWQTRDFAGTQLNQIGWGVPFITGTNLINNVLNLPGTGFTNARVAAVQQGKLCSRQSQYGVSGSFMSCYDDHQIFYALNRPMGPCKIPLTLKRVNYSSTHYDGGDSEVFFKDRAALPGEIRTGLYLCSDMANTYSVNTLGQAIGDNDHGDFLESYLFK